MQYNCTSLIKRNLSLIADFEKKLEKKNLKHQDNQNYLFEYLSCLYNDLYECINYSIILLDESTCNIIQKPQLLEQLESLIHLFQFLQTKYNDDGYWEIFANQMNEYETHRIFIEVKKFKFDNLMEYLTSLKSKNISKQNQKNNKIKNYYESELFEVSLEFAKGILYQKNNDRIKNKSTWDSLLESTFGENYTESHRQFVINTLNHRIKKTKLSKNIFRRRNAESEIMKVVNFCHQNNINICDEFKVHSKENNIYI